MTFDNDQELIPTPTDDQLALARDWHDGQSSMLYAVASTGTLRFGTRRPIVSDDSPYPSGWREATDREWREILTDALMSELRVVESCAERDMPDDAAIAYEWRDIIDTHCAQFRSVTR